MNFKQISRIHRGSDLHWVGDGFPVHTMFSYHEHGPDISPFLLLDYAGPLLFPPADTPRGVEQHPHRGFETVTIVYQGELEHRDNAGHTGKLGPGDVQWMTAGRGILHEEMHGLDFTRGGGMFEAIQLWVNLPAKDKMTEPAYQEIPAGQIPIANRPEDAGRVRVIAGDFRGVRGAAKTFTELNVWDVRAQAGYRDVFPVPDGHNAMILILKGGPTINGKEPIRSREVAFFTPAGDQISIETNEETAFLLMSGAPIPEPVAGHGPFVMNTQEEIRQAMSDYVAGLF